MCDIIPKSHLCDKQDRGIAQLVEYWSPKPRVVGSSPSAPAKTKRSPIGGLFVLVGIAKEGLEGAVVNDVPGARQSRDDRGE